MGPTQGGLDVPLDSLFPIEHKEFLDDLLRRYGIEVPSDEERRPVRQPG